MNGRNLENLDINNVEMVDAFFEAVIRKATPEQLASILRQYRSSEEIRADDEAEAKDAEEYERGEQ
jgi:hypothetical protein